MTVLGSAYAAFIIALWHAAIWIPITALLRAVYTSHKPQLSLTPHILNPTPSTGPVGTEDAQTDAGSSLFPEHCLTLPSPQPFDLEPNNLQDANTAETVDEPSHAKSDESHVLQPQEQQRPPHLEATLNGWLEEWNEVGEVSEPLLVPVSEGNKDGERQTGWSGSVFIDGFVKFFKQPMWPQLASLAMLYFTVLSLGLLMTSYLKWTGTASSQCFCFQN